MHRSDTVANATVSDMKSYHAENKLTSNANETNILLFSTKPLDSSPLIHINHKSVPLNDSVKFLGVYTELDLSHKMVAEKVKQSMFCDKKLTQHC